MVRLRGSVTLRLAIGYGTLTVGAMVAMATILYVGTVGVVDRSIDAKVNATSRQLLRDFDTGGVVALKREIEALLADNVDQDAEDYLFLDPDGRKIVGNLAGFGGAPWNELSERKVRRYDRLSHSRLLPTRLANGYALIVGRDLGDLLTIRQLVLRSTLIGGGIALILAISGAFLIRRQLETRIGTIRRTAQEIVAGNLSKRIPEGSGLDEFTKLNHSLNQMLDRIQHLVGGVRDVSNAIAHDLRTPLGRIRGLLDEALRSPQSADILPDRAHAAIRSIDDLTQMFDKLLQIAEAELGARRQSFHPVLLADIIRDVVELYDAAAEAKGVSLTAEHDPRLHIVGDKDLLASATANLVDNALKYTGEGATIAVRASREQDTVSIVVQDNGPGIPESERSNVVTRFYRLDRSRNLPGNGLGLPIVNAICHLHDGHLSLEDAKPGLRARIVLPRPDLTRYRPQTDADSRHRFD